MAARATPSHGAGAPKTPRRGLDVSGDDGRGAEGLRQRVVQGVGVEECKEDKGDGREAGWHHPADDGVAVVRASAAAGEPPVNPPV